MATYYGSKVELNVNSVNVIEPKMLPTGEVVVVSTITPTAAATNDVWEMMDIPLGATITGVAIDAAKLDTNGTPTIKLSVVDEQSTPHTFINQSTVAQTGGVAGESAMASGSIGLNYTATTRIHILVQTGAATFASGAVSLAVRYSMDP